MQFSNDVQKKILVIDDSPDSQSLLRTLFEANGHFVHMAPNGRDALTLLAELSELPSLILLDARMPIMDGFQFRTEQKNNARICDIPVIVMSGEENLDMDEMMRMPEAVMKKPLEMTSLLDCVAPFMS